MLHIALVVSVSLWGRHPRAQSHSGDPDPSTEDRVLTARLRQAGELLGITLLDHIILGDDRTYSFAEGLESRPAQKDRGARRRADRRGNVPA